MIAHGLTLHTTNAPPIRTLNIIEASQFLGAHKETVRRLAATGNIPSVKIGKGWRFIEQDLVIYMRSKYARDVTLQDAVHRSNEEWRFTKGTQLGGLASPIRDKEYNEALGLAIR